MLNDLIGGAWVSGAANAWPSMADMVLESYSRVVTVQMQYRLGAFGVSTLLSSDFWLKINSNRLAEWTACQRRRRSQCWIA